MSLTDCGLGARGCGRCDACRARQDRMAAEARAERQEQRRGFAKATPTAAARAADPETSHVAAAGVQVSENQRALLIIMRTLPGPVLDEELVKEYSRRRKAMRLPEQSESGIRSRRAELARMGKLEEGEKKKMKTGGIGRTWKIKGM